MSRTRNVRPAVRSFGERVLARLPKRLREIPADLVVPLLGAFAFVFALNAVVSTLATGRFSPLVAVGFLFASFFQFLVAFLVGRFLGRSVWPKHGVALSRRLLSSYSRHPERGDLVMTGRPEFRATRAKRIFETTALVASALVLYVVLTGAFAPLLGTILFLPALVGTVYLSVVLVPHWSFAHLGLRRVDRARFIVRPLTRDYSDRLRISNGALVVLVLALGGFALRQTGQSDAQAVRYIVQLALNLVPSAVILAAAAVAFYQRREDEVVLRVARDAIELGYRDARGENEQEILDSVRPPRPRTDAP